MPTSLPHASHDYKTHGPNRVPTFSASADPRSPETLGLWARNGAHVPANCGTPGFLYASAASGRSASADTKRTRHHEREPGDRLLGGHARTAVTLGEDMAIDDHAIVML